MRKLTTALLTILTVLILTGCGNDNKAVTDAAEGFLTALVNNDKEAASQYATEEFMKSDAMKLMDPQYLSDSFYEAMGVSRDDIDEESQKEVDDLKQRVKEGMAQAKLRGAQVGRSEGDKLTVKKSEPIKALIRELSRDFKGHNTDSEVMAILSSKTVKIPVKKRNGSEELKEISAKLSRNTYFKYKKEMREEV